MKLTLQYLQYRENNDKEMPFKIIDVPNLIPIYFLIKAEYKGFVAQWSRARVSEARSRGFNSLLAQVDIELIIFRVL